MFSPVLYVSTKTDNNNHVVSFSQKCGKFYFVSYFTHEKTHLQIFTKNLDNRQLLLGILMHTFALMGHCFMECPFKLFRQLNVSPISGYSVAYHSGTVQYKWGLESQPQFPTGRNVINYCSSSTITMNKKTAEMSGLQIHEKNTTPSSKKTNRLFH